MKGNFGVVPPFAIGGTLEMTDDPDSVPHRSKRLATVNDQGHHHTSPRSSSAHRRKGRAFVHTAPTEDRARDHIFPDTIPEQRTPPRLKQIREDRSRVRKGLKTEAEIIRDAPGEVRKLRVKKKHLASKNGLVLDEENFVTDLTQNGPAEVAGVQVGMQVLAVDAQYVANNAEAMNLMRCKEFTLTVSDYVADETSSSDGGGGAGVSPARRRGRTHSGTPVRTQQRSTSRNSTPRSGKRQGGDVWRGHQGYEGRDYPGAASWELEAAIQGETPGTTRQSESAKAALRRHHEKNKKLHEMHSDDQSGARRSRSPEDRDGDRHARGRGGGGSGGGGATITISPPRARADDRGGRDKSPSSGRKRGNSGGAGGRNLKPNHEFFNKRGSVESERRDRDYNDEKVQRFGTGVEVYTSPRRLAYDEQDTARTGPPAARIPEVNDPVLMPSGTNGNTTTTTGSSSVSNAPPTATIHTLSSARTYPVSQRTPSEAPPNSVSDTAKEEYRRRLSRYMTEGDKIQAQVMAQAQLQAQGLPVTSRREPLTPFQHSVATGYDRNFDSYRPNMWREADPYETGGHRSVSPPRGRLDTTESWLSDPAMRATTHSASGSVGRVSRGGGGGGGGGGAHCLCSTASSSLGRSYNCTHCNSACCMDCYWTGRCLQCKNLAAVPAPPPSHFRASEPPHLAEDVQRHRSASAKRRVCGKLII